MARQDLMVQKEAQQKLQAEQEKRTRDLDAREKAIKAKEDRLATISKKDRFGNATEKVLSNGIKIKAKKEVKAEESNIPSISPKKITPQMVRIPMALPANVKNSNVNNTDVKTLSNTPEKTAFLLGNICLC